VRISIIAGPSFSTFVGPEVVSWGRVVDDPKLAPRFHLGLNFGWTLNDYFSVEPGILYGTKGATYTGSQQYYNPTTQRTEQGDISYKKNLGYVQLPVMGKFRLSAKFCLQTGPKISVLANAKIRNDASQEMLTALQLQKTEDAKDDYKLIDLSWVFGLVYDLTDKISTQAAYDAGLNKVGRTTTGGEYPYPGGPVAKTYSAGIRNNVVQISVSYRIKG
jgi:hypothetical protein